MGPAERYLRLFLSRISPPADDEAGYRVFTREYDLVVDASEMDLVLGPLGVASKDALDEAWAAFVEALAGWKVRLSAMALASAERVRAQTSAEDRSNVAVSLLVDLSGSMKGEKLMLAAAAADGAQDYLGGLGVRTEVLGFTTRQWRGGRCRRDWYIAGMPRNPGRLNELLHIVFKSAQDNRRSTESWALRQMFRPGLLKENIDGEAVEWAVARLRALPAKKRILVVISDGAPVDDATLIENDTKYLINHLRSVIGATLAVGDVAVAGLGIEHDARRYYERCALAETPSEIGDRLFELLEALLLESGAAQNDIGAPS
jgi:cobaltochelatase CobT